ncbi:hypothetical protein IFM89_003529 [Coptis chinensis]|uniref:Uncharacterized protein n=1 Tax=Coptis chinensis TaxID=261450 RepID=A0A835GVE4_9MAGN|nr:hypothetical protein IFM89_003529 [Coptis chinensis]
MVMIVVVEVVDVLINDGGGGDSLNKTVVVVVEWWWEVMMVVVDGGGSGGGGGGSREIQSKIFDEENNTVIITGFFCCPCKFAKKLCCKAGKVIKSIEVIQIREPEKPDPEPDNPPIEDEPSPPVEPAPPPVEPVPAPPPVEPVPAPPPVEPMPPQVKIIGPIFNGYPPPPPPPFGGCCRPCYEGYGGGQCHCGYQLPVAPSPCYDYFGSRSVPCSCGCGGYRRCVSSCDYYASEENPNTCNISKDLKNVWYCRNRFRYTRLTGARELCITPEAWVASGVEPAVERTKEFLPWQ